MAFTLLDLMTAVAGDVKTKGLSADESGQVLTRVVTHHRDVRPGDVFWGLQGKNENGSTYAAQALMAGAAGVVIDSELMPPTGRWSVRVPDTLVALEQLAGGVRSGFSGSVDLAWIGFASADLASTGFAAATMRPDPVALTFTFGPICTTVIEIDLPALENSITAMLGWLMTEGFSFQPCDVSRPR